MGGWWVLRDLCVLYGFAVGFVIFYRVGVVLLWLCVFLWFVWICFAECAFFLCVFVVDPVMGRFVVCILYVVLASVWLVGRVWSFVHL